LSKLAFGDQARRRRKERSGSANPDPFQPQAIIRFSLRRNTYIPSLVRLRENRNIPIRFGKRIGKHFWRLPAQMNGEKTMNIRRLVGSLALFAITISSIAAVRYGIGQKNQDVGGIQSESMLAVKEPVQEVAANNGNESSTRALAIWGGQVLRASDRGEGCGLEVVIWNKNNTYAEGFDKGRYCHLSSIKVGVGDVVRKGDVVGTWNDNVPESDPTNRYQRFVHVNR
jgi:hypothetical protein